ncbi:MAG: hypothetical protein H6748_00590 [Spirochaetaceae bacterium]|nr:hypothetical protein [Spirochaetaceae bacterium]
MNPRTRNTLMIGGALIVVALLLVCGPLAGRFGGRQSEPPSVAAGPPVDAAGAAAVAAAGALAGAEAANGGLAAVTEELEGDPCDRPDEEWESVQARLDAGCPPRGGDATAAAKADDEGEKAAAGLVAGAGSGAGSQAGTAALAAGAAGATAAGATAAATAGSGAAAVGAAAAPIASDRFDEAMTTQLASIGGAAGPVVDRFAPPVAAAGPSPLGLAASARPLGTSAGDLRLACDNPGSGCRNVIATRLNPPAVPGRPTPGGGVVQE